MTLVASASGRRTLNSMKFDFSIGSPPFSGTLGDLKKVLPTEWCGTLPPGGQRPGPDPCVTLPGIAKDVLGAPQDAQPARDKRHPK